ncbi:30S ribosome-binding factor RbfA [Helicobacter mehlei]|uniref:30S ribosome-binding factor RbfA n=1 Tax=Helicobacter mehlei TaxID=2316080 RepID=A0A553V257_9HELI|nr:30S ribosome-binding factor RbfA [Helicobacter mehlei]TSA86311.1 30S ribosome-binding factor RbfA [Helicobacter mehlei]
MMDNIHAMRLDAVLLEYLQECLGMLGDVRLNGLAFSRVHCSKGKHHAHVYIDAQSIEPNTQQEVLGALKKATPLLRAYVLQVSGWFKCPHFSFHIDTALEQEQRLQKILESL